jgi:ThiF family
MRVLENRPEVTRRRDEGTPSTWLTGKRVLILGGGALGAPVAEHCMRAGVAALQVVDDGLVTPGILVRQPYNDADIGRPKATVLAERLSGVRAGFKVEGRYGDALDASLQPDHDMSSFDLVIDATADAGIRSAIIHPYLATHDNRLPLPLADLVPREAVIRYPTNFARMTPENLHLVATRGEQLTRILTEHYCPQLGSAQKGFEQGR